MSVASTDDKMSIATGPDQILARNTNTTVHGSELSRQPSPNGPAIAPRARRMHLA